MMTKELTHEEKLKAVRAKIIEAVPSIMELKFGCQIIMEVGKHNGNQKRIKKNDEIFIFLAYCKESKKRAYLAGNTPQIHKISQFKEIIGRPIRLSDVLCAIEGINLLYTIRADGLFMKRKGEIVHKMEYDFVYSDNGNIMWNLLNDDLNNQKPETISFLFDLLC